MKRILKHQVRQALKMIIRLLIQQVHYKQESLSSDLTVHKV